MVQCAWCWKQKINGKWIDVGGKIITETHGICPECKKEVLVQMRRKQMSDFLLKCGIDYDLQEELNEKIMRHKNTPSFMEKVSLLCRMMYSMSVATMEESEVPECIVDNLMVVIADILSFEEGKE